MKDNFWLGDNELVIRFVDGRHVVLEKYEDGAIVFAGSFGQCYGYCENRRREYEKSII